MKYLQYQGRTGFILPRNPGRNSQHYSRYRLVKYEIFTRGEVQRMLEKGYKFPESYFKEIDNPQFRRPFIARYETTIANPHWNVWLVRKVRLPSPEYDLTVHEFEEYSKGLYMNESYSEEQERSAFEKCH